MALSVKVGSITTPASIGSVATTGLGFQPRAIIFWTAGSGTTSGTWVAGILASLGYGASMDGSTFTQAAVGFGVADNVATSDTSRRMAGTVAISAVNAAGSAVVAEAALTAFGADGFTLNWTTTPGATTTINYMALGGTDITGAKVVFWDGAAGAVAVTGTGFSPDLLVHTSIGVVGALPLGPMIDARFVWGVANKHGQQWSNSYASTDGAAASNTSRWQQTDSSIARTATNEIVANEAHFVSMDADGFSVTSPTATAAVRMATLCLKGLSSKIGVFAKTTGAAPAAQGVTRVGFTPKVVLFSDQSNTSVSAPVAAAYWALGASDGTNQRSVEMADQDAITPTIAKSIFRTNACISDQSNAGVTATVGATTSLDSDGFSLSFNPNITSYSEEILYLAIGNSGANSFPVRVG